MSNLRNMKADILTIALGGGTEEEIKDKIDNLMKKYIVEYSQLSSISHLTKGYIKSEDYSKYREFQNKKISYDIGSKLLEHKIIKIEFIKDEESPYFSDYNDTWLHKLWVLK